VKEIYIEQMYSNHREKAISGNFTFVALDENKNQQKNSMISRN
jgi:acyl-CoA hydrolase